MTNYTKYSKKIQKAKSKKCSCPEKKAEQTMVYILDYKKQIRKLRI